jgi:Flp pilus assembly protein TadG
MKWTSPNPVASIRRRGSAIIEFCLGSSVLVAIFAGTFHFGYTILQYNLLQNAVVQGARYASVIPYDSTSTTPSASFLAAVRNMTQYGSPTAGLTPAISNLSATNITLTVGFFNGVPSTMSVAVNGYTVNTPFGASTLVDKPKATFPYHGIWSPY